MNVLILNWRDPKNPLAGGAEKLNLEILKPLIERGDNVTWYAKSVRGLPNTEIYQGIKIIRFGGLVTHFIFWPFFILMGKFGKVDFIIDSIHGIGYFSNILAPKTKKVILICEVALNLWDETFPLPISTIGRILEKLMFISYSKNRFWTISQSTLEDLTTMRIQKHNIKILPMGFNAPPDLNKQKKYSTPTALFVGRLAEMKGVKDAIESIALLNFNPGKKWSLRIIGRGSEEFERKLREKVSALGIKKYVDFLGFASENEKFYEMSRTWVLLVPSSREGWGMIVTEANYAGTQVVAYDSAGLRDSVKKSSTKNLIIGRRPESIRATLKNIKKPLEIHSGLRPGWEKLHKEVMRNIEK